jgi:hypothetical protein
MVALKIALFIALPIFLITWLVNRARDQHRERVTY